MKTDIKIKKEGRTKKVALHLTICDVLVKQAKKDKLNISHFLEEKLCQKFGIFIGQHKDKQ